MSHVMDDQLMILKREVRGRVRSTAEAAAEFRRNGLNAFGFAKMAGISNKTFWNWLHSQGQTKRSALCH